MALASLCRYLQENGAEYTFEKHALAFTAQEVAAQAHIPGRQVAKTVMVKLDGRMVMAVLPAVFDAGNHRDLIRVPYDEDERLVQPRRPPCAVALHC